MKKIILLLICLFVITGCTVTYEVNFDYDLIEERISGSFNENIYEVADSLDGDGYYLEKEIVDKNIPAYYDFSDFYNTNINYNNNRSDVELKYEWRRCSCRSHVRCWERSGPSAAAPSSATCARSRRCGSGNCGTG